MTMVLYKHSDNLFWRHLYKPVNVQAYPLKHSAKALYLVTENETSKHINVGTTLKLCSNRKHGLGVEC